MKFIILLLSFLVAPSVLGEGRKVAPKEAGQHALGAKAPEEAKKRMSAESVAELEFSELVAMTNDVLKDDLEKIKKIAFPVDGVKDLVFFTGLTAAQIKRLSILSDEFTNRLLSFKDGEANWKPEDKAKAETLKKEISSGHSEISKLEGYEKQIKAVGRAAQNPVEMQAINALVTDLQRKIKGINEQINSKKTELIALALKSDARTRTEAAEARKMLVELDARINGAAVKEGEPTPAGWKSVEERLAQETFQLLERMNPGLQRSNSSLRGKTDR